MLEGAAMLGIWPREALAMTLPELVLAVRGRQRAYGLDPDSSERAAPMSRQRLDQLAKELEE